MKNWQSPKEHNKKRASSRFGRSLLELYQPSGELIKSFGAERRYHPFFLWFTFKLHVPMHGYHPGQYDPCGVVVC